MPATVEWKKKEEERESLNDVYSTILYTVACNPAGIKKRVEKDTIRCRRVVWSEKGWKETRKEENRNNPRGKTWKSLTPPPSSRIFSFYSLVLHTTTTRAPFELLINVFFSFVCNLCVFCTHTRLLLLSTSRVVENVTGEKVFILKKNKQDESIYRRLQVSQSLCQIEHKNAT